MKCLFTIVMLIPFVARLQAQQDTIFRVSGPAIVCTITHIEAEYIYFDVYKSKDRYIHKENVLYYSVNGKRENALVPMAYQPGGSLKDTVILSQELDFMKQCLRKCHKEYIIGLSAIGGAALLNVTGGLLLEGSAEVGITMIFLGVVSFIAGEYMMIDSHKWINRAGLGLTGRGGQVGVYYRLK